MRRLKSLLFATLACGVLVPGCGPAPQPVWNKDSQSFFYAHSDGSVRQFDLEKQASRTLVTLKEAPQGQVALSPTLPFLTVAKAAHGPQSRAVQAGMVSLLHGGVIWSDLEVWGNPKARRDASVVSCYWCPTGKRVLIWYQPTDVLKLENADKALGAFAVLDPESREVSELTTAPPAMLLAQAIHTSPLCPDGSGYLAMKLAESGPQFLFVSWDGWEYPLELSPDVAEPLNMAGNKQASDEEKMKNLFPLPQGVWSEHVLRFPIEPGLVSIDVKRRKIALEPLPPKLRQELDQIRAADQADAPWTTVQRAHFQGDRYALHCRFRTKDPAQSARVELVDEKLQRRRMLFEGALMETFVAHHLFPSPDGRHILALLRDRSGKSLSIHVVAADGTIVAKVDAGAIGQKGSSR